MAGRCRIALRQVRDLSRGETIWDSAVAGFGARRQEGAIAYFLKYRNAAGLQRWYTIGRHGAPWTPETARVKAKEILGEVAKGEILQPKSDLCARRPPLTSFAICTLRTR
jgi:hypothetical protein